MDFEGTLILLHKFISRTFDLPILFLIFFPLHLQIESDCSRHESRPIVKSKLSKVTKWERILNQQRIYRGKKKSFKISPLETFLGIIIGIIYRESRDIFREQTVRVKLRQRFPIFRSVFPSSVVDTSGGSACRWEECQSAARWEERRRKRAKTVAGKRSPGFRAGFASPEKTESCLKVAHRFSQGEFLAPRSPSFVHSEWSIDPKLCFYRYDFSR